METPRPKAEKRKKSARPSWPVTYKWLATGALVAYTAVGTKTVAPAYGQHRPAPLATAGAAQREAPHGIRFDIPAGMLDAALSAFEEATHWRVIVPEQEMLSLPSPGVSGVHSAESALKALLTDSGVSFEVTAPATATLAIVSVATTVDVRAHAEPSSPKYTATLRDIPQTISIIPRTVIEQQGAVTLTDVLRNVPGLTVVAGEGGTPAGDNLTLRGFSARNDVFVDGVRDIGPQSRDPFNLEQVEVVKGPQSAMTGRGSTGGSINMVSKTPSIGRFLGASLNLGTNDMARVAGDVNTPVPMLGERTAFRLNFLAHQSGVAGRNVVENSRWGVAPSLAFGLGSPTRFTLGYFKLKQDNISDYGIPWVPASHNVLAEYRDKPAPVPRETFYGFRDRDKEKMGSDMGTFRVEHDFSDGVTLSDQFRYGRSNRDSMATPPRFADPDTTEINREMRSWITQDEVYDNQLDFTAEFPTGGIKHTVVSGMALSHENNQRQNRSAPNALTTLLNPNPDDVYGGQITLDPNVGDIDGNTRAFYVFDTVNLGQRWQLNGGVRSENYSVEGISRTLVPLANSEHMLSLRAGAVFRPARNGSLYASYGSSLNPSLEGLSYVGRGDDPTLDPEKTYTVELGTKWDLFGDRLLLSGALFNVNKTNARTPGILPDDPPQVLDGKQRVRGVELAATGNLTSSWTLFAGYTYLDSEIVESNNLTQIGNKFPQAPDHSFNLWTTYTFPWRVTLGGGVRYIGRRYNNTSNARFVDGYWTGDAMASVPITKNIDLRANLSNVSNEYYFERLGGGHVIPGPSRTLMVSTNFRF